MAKTDEGPRVLSCGCIYDPTPEPGGATHIVYMHGEHRAIGDAFAINTTPETIEAFKRLSKEHHREINEWNNKRGKTE